MDKVQESGRRGATSPAAGRPRRRRYLRAAAAVGGTLAVLAVAAMVAAGALFPPARLTPLLRVELARRLAAPVRLERAEVRVFPRLSIRLDGLALGDPRGFARPASWPQGGLVTARRAEASLALLPLLSRRLEVHAVRLEDVDVTAVRNERGIGNWEFGETAAPPPGGSTTFDLDVRRIDLARARIRSYDARDGLYLEVRRLDASLALRRTGGGRDQRLRLNAAAIGLGGRTPWPLGDRPISFDADLESREHGARWLVRRVGLARGRLALSGSGSVEGPERTLTFALDQTTVPLHDLLELLPADQVRSLGRLEGRGTLRLAAQAAGPLTRGRMPAVRARARLEDGRLAFADRGLALEGLALDLAASEHGADLTRLVGRIGKSTFEVSGLARDWADPRLRARIHAALDLADVQRFLPLADSTRLAGLARVAIDGAGRTGSAREFGWSGQIDLARVTAAGIGLGRPVEGVSGAVGLAPGRAWARGLTARIGVSDLTIDGTVEHPFEWFVAAGGGKPAPADAVARLAVRSNRLDLDQLLPPARSSAKLPPVRAEGTFEVANLHVRKLDATRARGRFTYGHGVTAIEEFALDAYGGRGRGRAWFDLTDLAAPRYQVNATAESLDANTFISAWTPAKNIAFGTLQMSIDLDGTGLSPADITRSLTVKGLAQVLGGRLAGSNVFARLAEFTGVDRFRILSFRDLSAPFRIVSGRVVLDPIALTSGDTDWLAKGSVGLDGTLDLAIAGLVPASRVGTLPAALRTTAGALLAPDGRLTLDLHLGGNVQRPSFSWDSRHTASRLLASLSQQALDALALRVGTSLGDSLSSSQESIEDRADALVAAQKAKLAEEAERRRREMENKAVEQLTGLFERRTKPPPAPPDSAASPDAPTAPDSAAAP